ncbi:MAG TPA: cytochrome d ubiquinol oxidase subunit II [Candidatus Dormibacteraeota bacterium]|nr:cytochrome d ubiquinol oxidase subunit II [Candidatus Dormibacteraeota bacterium]
MSPAVLDYAVAAILWSAVIAYAVFAGADFGGGIWDLLATGPRGEVQRRSVSRAMGPVWEANHVWLIFMITGLFTAFPATFATLAVGLYLPFSLAALGIVLRGAAFAFRAHARDVGREAFGRAFGIASAATPFVLGACAGAVAAGRVRPVGGDLLAPWTTPFALACGALALSICAGLAAAYLTVEEDALGHPALTEDFRRRALLAGGASTVIALVTLPLTRIEAPALLDGLLGRALPLTLLTAGLAIAAGAAMLRRRYRLARLAAAGQVAALLGAWAFAQAPYLVPPNLSVEGTAAQPQVIGALLVVYALGGALLVPSLILLFRVFKGRNPAAL